MPSLASEQLIGANFSFQHYPFERVAEVMREFGFRQLELWGIAPHLDLFHADAAKIDRVRRVLADNELSVWCFTPEQVIYPINVASGDDDFRAASVAHFRRAADIAAALGASYLFLTSGRGYETEPRERAWARAAGSLANITEHAAQLGLRCLLEPLQRVETNVVLSAADVRRMLDEVGADNLDVVLDTVAMATAGNSVADYVDLFGDRLAHVQLVDGSPAGHLVWGDGTLPLGNYLTDLAVAGYRGKVTFEPFGDGTYALDPVAAWQRNLDGIRPYLVPAAVASA
jgi:protein FrlC